MNTLKSCIIAFSCAFLWTAEATADGPVCAATKAKKQKRSDIVVRDLTQSARPNIGVGSFDGESWVPGKSYGPLGRNVELHFADVNGDGGSDLLGRDLSMPKETRMLGLAFSNGKSWNKGKEISGPGPQSFMEVYFADLNGDGRDDLITRNLSQSTGQNIRFALSVGGYFGTATDFGPIGRNVELHFVDMNGDEKADLVAVDRGANRDSFKPLVPNVGFILSDENGLGSSELFGNSPNQIGPIPPHIELNLADINGDGRADLITRDTSPYASGVIGYSLSQGDSWSSGHKFGGNVGEKVYPQPLPGTLLYFADVNGDGCDDMIVRDVAQTATANIRLYLSKGTTFQPMPNAYGPMGTNIELWFTQVTKD